MKKYYYLFKVQLETSLFYRFDILGNILIELISISGFLFLWWAAGKGGLGTFDLSIDEVIIYYVYAPLAGAITSCWISRRLGAGIKDGDLSTDLVKPWKPIFAEIICDISRKVYYLLTMFLIYTFISILLILFLDFDFNVRSTLLFLIVAVCGYFLKVSLDLTISLLAFWIDDVWSFKHFKYILVSAFGGRGFPLSLYSQKLFELLIVLPFAYFYYVPLTYLLGKRTYDDLFGDIIIMSLWIILFSIIIYFMWKAGIKKYGAYGN